MNNLEEVKKYIQKSPAFEINIYPDDSEGSRVTCVDVHWSECSGTSFSLAIPAKDAYDSLRGLCGEVNRFESKKDYYAYMGADV